MVEMINGCSLSAVCSLSVLSWPVLMLRAVCLGPAVPLALFKGALYGCQVPKGQEPVTSLMQAFPISSICFTYQEEAGYYLRSSSLFLSVIQVLFVFCVFFSFFFLFVVT